MSTLKTRWGSDIISVSANWNEASDQVTGDITGGYQVADFRHRPQRALRRALEQCAAEEGMSAEDSAALIETALDNAEEE